MTSSVFFVIKFFCILVKESVIGLAPGPHLKVRWTADVLTLKKDFFLEVKQCKLD